MNQPHRIGTEFCTNLTKIGCFRALDGHLQLNATTNNFIPADTLKNTWETSGRSAYRPRSVRAAEGYDPVGQGSKEETAISVLSAGYTRLEPHKSMSQN